jgi:hypothetical protein
LGYYFLNFLFNDEVRSGMFLENEVGGSVLD